MCGPWSGTDCGFGGRVYVSSRFSQNAILDDITGIAFEIQF